MKLTKVVYIGSLYIFFILNIFPSQLFARISLAELKETYAALKDDFKSLSLLHGAAWWETGMIEKYYDFDNYRKEEKKSASAIAQLLYEFFHRVAGEFTITTSPDNPANFFTHEIIGKILGTIHKQLIQREPKESLQKALENVLLEHKTMTLLGMKSKNQKKNYTKRFNLLPKLLADALDEAGLFDLSSNASYLSVMPYAILLSFAYRKVNSKYDVNLFFNALSASIGEDVLQKPLSDEVFLPADMMQTVNQLTDGTLSIDTLNENDVDYERAMIAILGKPAGNIPKKIQYANVSFEGNKFANCSETVIRNIIGVLFYDFDLQEFLLERFLQENKSINSDKIHENLKNFYKKTFKIFGQIISTQNAVHADKNEVHQLWNDVVLDRPWVAYNRLSKSGLEEIKAPHNTLGFIWMPNQNNISVKTIEEIQALFPNAAIQVWDEPGVFKLTINDRTYLVFDHDQYHAFELQPSIKNFIVLLNDLLGLELFNVNRSVDFSRKDFNAIFFPEVCKQLQWTCSGLMQNIDQDDYTSTKLKLTIQSAAGSFSISSTSGHAEYHAMPQQSLILSTINSSIEQLLEKLKNDFSNKNIALMTSQFNVLFNASKPSCNDLQSIINKVFPGDFPNQLLHKYLLLSFDLHDIDIRCEIIEYILEFNTDAELLPFMQKLVATLPEQEDFVPQTRVLKSFLKSSWVWQTNLLKNAIFSERIIRWAQSKATPTSLNFCKKLIVDKGVSPYECLGAIFLGLRSEYSDIVTLALDLFKTYFNADNAFDAGVKAIAEVNASTSHSASDERYKKRCIDKIFIELVDQNKELEAIASSIAHAMKRGNADVRSAGLEIFTALVKKNQAIDKAITVCRQELQGKNFDVISMLDLITELVNKGKAFDLGIAIASGWFKKYGDAHSLILYSRIHFFEALINKGQAFDVAINYASQCLRNNEISTGIDLFTILVNAGQAFNEAIDAATQNIQSTDQRCIEAVLKLFQALVNQGKAFDEALDAVLQYLKNEKFEVKKLARDLLTTLSNQDSAFNKVVAFATQGLQDKNYGIRMASFDLFASWVKQGKAFSEAADIASQYLQSDDLVAVAEGLELFTNLVNQNQAYDKAYFAASQELQNKEKYVRKYQAQLLEALIKKGQKISEIKKILADDKLNFGLKDIKNSAGTTYFDLLQAALESAPQPDPLKQRLQNLKESLETLKEKLRTLSQSLSSLKNQLI